MDPDRRLVEAAAAGDREAFDELVRRHQGAIVGLARSLTGGSADAEDLAQEVFVKAYRGFDDFRGEASAFSWLYRITVNTFLNTRRKKALRFRQLWDDFSHRPTHDEAAPETSVETEAVQRHIAQALDRLSPRERSAFVLRHYHELSIKEIAIVLEIAEGTVKSLLFRGVQKLREVLAFYRDELGLTNE